MSRSQKAAKLGFMVKSNGVSTPACKAKTRPSLATQKKSAAPSFQPGDNDLGYGTMVKFFPQAFASQGKQILELLQVEVPWEQKEITVMGRKVMQPRLVAYMADDPSLGYTYSRTKQEASPWTPTVLSIKNKIEELSGARFNSCLLNLYRDGKDSLSWHSDNEKPYGQAPTIGSVSFGHSREFVLRNNHDRSRRYTISLGSEGDTLFMSGNCQRDWQHSIPKRANANQARVNLTFRKIIDKELTAAV